MPAINTQVGPSVNQDGTTPIARGGKTGEVITGGAHSDYYEATVRGNVFSLSVASAAAITAYTGGAGGTPQVAIWNPAGNTKNFVLLIASIANIVAASAAGTVTWGIYVGQTAAITQATTTAPRNNYSLSQAGSSGTGFSAVALTSSTALASVIPVAQYYWATGAGAVLGTPFVDLKGLVVIPPGSMAALGGSAALTSATWISYLSWEEVSI